MNICSVNFFFTILLAESFENRKQIVSHINFSVSIGNI